jgi:NAD-dependent SIR2 family protein deacetylase
VAETQSEKLKEAAGWLQDADGLLVTAGAGMGVDSGLPDFRGEDGFWRAYPALRQHRMAFEDMANPATFITHPDLAWGFYGHRLKLYRETVPHDGFQILRAWAARTPRGAFVFTSNVDGQFQKSGFSPSRVHECHGSIHLLQCLEACTDETWTADDFKPNVNEATSRLENAMPRCPGCGGPARPSILMFGDWGWVDRPFAEQQDRLGAWLASVTKLVVVELGAGRALPTVRRFSERHARGRLIRINPRDFQVDPRHGVGIEGGAVEILKQIDARLHG